MIWFYLIGSVLSIILNILCTIDVCEKLIIKDIIMSLLCGIVSWLGVAAITVMWFSVTESLDKVIWRKTK